MEFLFDGSYDVTVRGGYSDLCVHSASWNAICDAIDEYQSEFAREEN